MNRFFSQKPVEFEMPRRVYAKQIDGDSDRYLLYDAIDALWLDAELTQRGEQVDPATWGIIIENAPIYAVEINSRDGTPGAALDWLSDPYRPHLRWVAIELEADYNGPAEIYASSVGPATRAQIAVSPLSPKIQHILKAATNLSPLIAGTANLNALIPATTIEQIVVLDVGQGFASALIDCNGEVIAYADLGAGVLADAGTRPSSMAGLCFCRNPIVLLSHWHYDHFESANIYPAARNLTWIAPLQTLGPGPQSAMASAIASSGTLMIWSGTGTLGSGPVQLERCTGPSGNPNRTGLAVWIDGPKNADSVLLPGDAGYVDIPGLNLGRSISSLAASHHGGKASGKPPTDPGLATTRLAMSYGHKNSYGHPLPASLKKLVAANWTLGPFPGIAVDERRTEDRTGGVGLTGLGHIGIQWPTTTAAGLSCSCGSTMAPTQ